MTDFVGNAKRLESVDISRIGARIGVGEDEIHAFMEVEASGSGFDQYGRPKMLFEPHIFYRELSGADRARAVDMGLAYRRWGQEPYPADSYPRLARAMEIDVDAALKSASWGLGQILGTNYEIVGYVSIQAMVEDFMDDEENHLEAMVNFLIANNIDDDLRAHRWATVARVYNGPGYARHGYHTRLAAAYRKWANIPDTPWEGDLGDGPAEVVSRPQQYPVVRLGSSGFVVAHLQTKLSELGYHAGARDGHFGAATRASVLAFQADHDLTTDGVVGEETWGALERSARPKPVSDERREATVADLRSAGSETIKNGDFGQIAAGVTAATGVFGVVGKVSGAVEEATRTAEEVSSAFGQFFALMSDNWPVLLLIGGGVAAYYIHQMKEARVRDHQSGANMGR